MWALSTFCDGNPCPGPSAFQRAQRAADDVACFDGLLSLSAWDGALAEQNTGAS